MGYRSEVALALTKKGVETLENRLASPEIGEEVRNRIREFLDHADKHAKDEGSGQEAWYWDYLKWYTGAPVHFPEVDFIEKLIAELPDGDFRFIRIGEDYDDTDSSASARTTTTPRCVAASGKIPSIWNWGAISAFPRPCS